MTIQLTKIDQIPLTVSLQTKAEVSHLSKARPQGNLHVSLLIYLMIFNDIEFNILFAYIK